jgi:hypothetical protein
MRDALDGASVGHREQLIHAGQALLAQAKSLAGE